MLTPLSTFVEPGKINMILDGQFGSTGKGLIASVLAEYCHIDVAVGRLSPNAGHTFYWHGKKHVSKMLPVTGIMQERTQIFLSAGSVIDLDEFFKEVDTYGFDEYKVQIHPRAAVVTKENKEEEARADGVKRIASTQSGAGAARASKLMRKNPLAANVDALKPFVISHRDIADYVWNFKKNKLCVLVETGQGFDLGLQFGFDYPHCTSVDCLPSSVLADIGAHPHDLGNVMMTMRTYPIRVGNITEGESLVGYSGDVYPDSKELTWEELQQIPELTTVTKRVRRVFSFSIEQYRRSLQFIRPTHIFLNFYNYLKKEDIDSQWYQEMCKIRLPHYAGLGPTVNDVVPFLLAQMKLQEL